MPKGGKKGDKKNNRDIASDITLSDFANCSARTGRLRKSAGSTLNQEVQQIRDSEALWFERDIDEFQFPEATNEIRKKQRSKVSAEDLLSRPGVCYPIDVWFLIGQFIKPEDVKIFASICKDSYLVSRTYSFWMKMYKRHYQPEAHLPQRLQPECIEGSFCLKMFVIRALYHMYPHFTNQLATRMSSDVKSLSNLCCTTMWRIQQNGMWLFHFKFQAPNSGPTPVTYGVAIQDLWTSHDSEDEKNREMYVNHNPEEGCKILRILCSHFVAVPPFVMGSRLSDVRINLAHDMRRQKLRLTFCYSNYRKPNNNITATKDSGGYGDIVEFDPVESVTILNWWHPQYPSVCKV